MSDSKRPAIFVDRDNTLIHDPGYLRHADHVRLLSGVGEAVAQLRTAGFPVVVVTNQSGVARGYLTEEELAAVHQRMQELLQTAGSGVDAIYYCPYLTGPDAVVEEYRKESDLRKPKPGMLQRAALDMNLDLAASWMIGDSERDILAGKAVGCRTILIGNGNLNSETLPDFTAASFAKAADLVLKETKRRAQAMLPKPEMTAPSARAESSRADSQSGAPESRTTASAKPITKDQERHRSEKVSEPAASPPVTASQARVLEPAGASVASSLTSTPDRTQAPERKSETSNRPVETRAPIAPASSEKSSPSPSAKTVPVAPTVPAVEPPASPRESTKSSGSPPESRPDSREQGGGKITGEPLPNSVVQPPKKASESSIGSAEIDGHRPAVDAASMSPSSGGDHQPSIGDVLEELRTLKRDQRFKEFSFGQLAGAIAQAFAVCSLGFGLHAIINGESTAAELRLLLAIVFQLMALTGFLQTRR